MVGPSSAPPGPPPTTSAQQAKPLSSDMLHAIDIQHAADSRKTGKKLEQPENKRARILLEVNDMMCASCSGTVRNGLAMLDGVESTEVSLLTKRADVLIDTSKVTMGEVVEAVCARGRELALSGHRAVGFSAHSQTSVKYRICAVHVTVCLREKNSGLVVRKWSNVGREVVGSCLCVSSSGATWVLRRSCWRWSACW